MAKDFATKFYNSKEWKQTRKAYIASVFGLCEKCKQIGDIVHHKIHLTPDNINDAYITLSHDNLMYLCITHHNQIHGNSSPTREDVRFDDKGQLVPV